MATVDGDPSYNIDINNSGSQGSFRVRDDAGSGANTLLFAVSTSGEVQLTNKLTRHGGVQLLNSDSSSAILAEHWSQMPFGGPSKRMEFVRDSGAHRVVGRTVDSADAWRLEVASSTGTILELANSGGNRLSFAWDSGSTKAIAAVDSDLDVEVGGALSLEVDGETYIDAGDGLVADVAGDMTIEVGGDAVIGAGDQLTLAAVGSATTDVKVRAGRTAYMQVGVHSSGGGGLVVQDAAEDSLLVVSQDAVTSFWSGGVKYGFYQATDGAAQPTTTLEVGEDSSRGFVRLRADTTDATQRPGAIVFEPQNTGTAKQVYLWLYYDVGAGLLKLVADTVDPGTGVPDPLTAAQLGQWPA